LVDSSGDSQTDRACMTAVSGVDQTRIGPLFVDMQKLIPGSIRVRIYCHLLKDTPPL
jgi:hypothetical protein